MARTVIDRKPETLLLISDPLETHTETLLQIARWRLPRKVEVVGDIFHPDIEERFLYDALWMFRTYPEHRFTITTAYPHRWRDSDSHLPYCPNVNIRTI